MLLRSNQNGRCLEKEIKDVFLNMKDDEEGAEAMSLWGHQGYEEAADSAYDTIREYTEKSSRVKQWAATRNNRKMIGRRVQIFCEGG